MLEIIAQKVGVPQDKLNNIRTLDNAVDTTRVIYETYQVKKVAQVLRDLHVFRKEVDECLKKAQDVISQMSEEEKATLCQTISHALEKFFSLIFKTTTNPQAVQCVNDIKQCVVEGRITIAVDKIDELYQKERENYLSLERFSAGLDAGSSICCLFSKVHFIFSGCRKLKGEDDRAMRRLKRQMGDIEEMYNTAVANGLDQGPAIRLLKDQVRSMEVRTDQREDDRNRSLISGTTYLIKCGVNLFRYYYFKDVDYSSLYLFSGGLCSLASGTSFYVAYEYHDLLQELRKTLDEVTELYEELNPDHQLEDSNSE